MSVEPDDDQQRSAPPEEDPEAPAATAAGADAPDVTRADAGEGAAEDKPPASAWWRTFGALREFVTVAAIAIVLSFLVKTFLVQPFFIPSESMENTLVRGDRVIVSKLTPSPIDLKRGDIVVFADPGDWLAPTEQTDRGAVLNAIRSGLTFVGLLPDSSEGHLIKRLIGLPGDQVSCCDSKGRLEVNGKAIDEPYIKLGEEPSDIEFDITVPAGKIWVMGDNRGHSSDSRLHDPSADGSDGSVPEDLVVGRAVATIWPLNRISWLSNYDATFADVPPRPEE
ncbi:MAG: signal peptidase I [Tetrasphaera sp.]